jgi:hypothetical protein
MSDSNSTVDSDDRSSVEVVVIGIALAYIFVFSLMLVFFSMNLVEFVLSEWRSEKGSLVWF